MPQKALACGLSIEERSERGIVTKARDRSVERHDLHHRRRDPANASTSDDIW